MRRLLLLALAVLVVLIAVNTVVTDNETKPAKADIGRILRLQAGDIQVREDGPRERPAVVLLHGFANSMHWWTPVTQRLARSFRVIRFDLLGHGGSEKPRHGYSMQNQARLVDQALSVLRVDRALVVGHSMGGSVATALTELNPSEVSGVVVVDSPSKSGAGELPFLARLGFVPVLGEAIRRVLPDSAVRDNLEKAFAKGFDVPDQFVRDFNRMTYSSYDASHQKSDDYGDQRGLADRLARLRKPLLAIQGTEDEFVDPDSAREYEKVPGARLVYVPNTGHSPMVEAPDRVSELIAGFAREHAR
jgi:pimeloyl-ACP methyl ester carboxylesterase